MYHIQYLCHYDDNNKIENDYNYPEALKNPIQNLIVTQIIGHNYHYNHFIVCSTTNTYLRIKYYNVVYTKSLL